MRSAIAGFFAMALAMGIGRFVFTPILPFMIDADNLSTSQGGLAAGSNFIGYLIGALLAALPIFAPNRQKWLFLALASSIATTLLSGVWLKPIAVEFFYFIRFLSGVASAFCLIFVSTIVMQNLQSENRPELISVHFAGVGFAICCSSLIVSLSAGFGVNWQGFWFAASLFALILFVPVLYLLLSPSTHATQVAQAQSNQSKPTAANQEPRYRPFSPSFWLLLISYGIFGFAYSISGTFLNTIAKVTPSLNSAQPYVWLVVGLAIIPSTWIWFKLAKKIGDMYTYAIACLVEAVGVLLIWLVVTPVSLLLSGALFGFTFIALTALGLAKARRMAANKAAQAVALMTASFGFGQMLGPVFAGFSADQSGNFDTALITSAIMSLLTAILALLSKAIEHKSCG